jgi:hypothetical protein
MTLYQRFALITALFPLLLSLGILLIPVVRSYADHELAQQAAAKSQRWFWGHLLSAVAFVFSILVACCLAVYLHTTDVFRLAMLTVPVMAVGAGLLAVGLGADGIGPLAVRKAGYPARAFFDGSSTWVTGTFIAGSVIYGLGQIGLMVAIQHTSLLAPGVGILVMIVAILFSVSSAIPSGYGLYLVAFLAWLIYLPISIALWSLTG